MKNKVLISNPHLEITLLKNNRVRIDNPFYNLKLEAHEKILLIINAFKTPKKTSEVAKKLSIETKVLESLLNMFFLIDHAELKFLELGFFMPSSNIIGQSLSWEQLTHTHTIDSHFGIIGFPIDLGGEYGGAREAPDAIRKELLDLNINLNPESVPTSIIDYEFNRKYNAERLKVFDLGNITYNIGEPLETVGERVSKLFSECLDKNIKPLVLGGDHSLSWFTIRTLSKKFPEFGIIHFDAHHDFYELTILQKNNLDHGNSFKFALQEGNLKMIYQIGLRTIENFEVQPYKNKSHKVIFISSLQASQRTTEEILRPLNKAIPYYISFDVDCLDFPIYQETGTPIVGGLSFYKALEIIDQISLNFKIIGCDFVELAPKPNSPTLGGKLVARLMLNLILNDLTNEPIFSTK